MSRTKKTDVLDFMFSSDTSEDLFFKKALRASLITHCVLALFILLYHVIGPGKPRAYIPSIRVDLVALPDVKKAELGKMKPESLEKLQEKIKEVEKSIKETDKKLSQKKVKEQTIEDPTDQMVMKKTEKVRKKSMNDALDKIKALQSMEEAVKAKQEPVKGNRLSKGSQMSGEESADAVNLYIDALVSKIRNNWNLPLWLSKQNLNAKILLYIDRSGHVAKVIFMKASGNEQFDRYVENTIRKAAPFEHPPGDIESDGIMLGFPL